jgi:hypothetical protein
MFIADLVESKGNEYFESYLDRPKVLGTLLGTLFIEWTEQKAETTDEVLRMCLFFLKTTRKYKLFRLAVRYGDAILVEYLYEYFIPVWLMTGKHNYVEIALNQIEDLYGRIPFHILQVARENRMQPIHVGANRDGVPHAHWAMDALMELLQIKYKSMNFPNSRDGWQSHSTNMPLVARAKTFSQTEYSRRYDVDSYDEQFFEFDAAGNKQDKGNNKKQTTVPRRHKEKIMISEILQLVDVFSEVENRKMTNETFWKALKDLTTTFVDETNKESDAADTEGRSEGELALVQINREMLHNTPLEDETTEEVAEGNEMDQLAWLEELERENSALVESDCEEGEDVETPARQTVSNSTTNVHIVVDDGETEVTIGTSKLKVMVRKAVLNRMGLQDVYNLGRKKMIILKIPDVRYRKQCRLKREIATLQMELNKYLTNKDGESKLKALLAKLRTKVVLPDIDARVEFRMMKKLCWIDPSNDLTN